MSKIEYFRSYSYNIDWHFLLNELLEMLQHMRRCSGVQNNGNQKQAVPSALAGVQRPDNGQYIVIKSKQRACGS